MSEFEVFEKKEKKKERRKGEEGKDLKKRFCDLLIYLPIYKNSIYSCQLSSFCVRKILGRECKVVCFF